MKIHWPDSWELPDPEEYKINAIDRSYYDAISTCIKAYEYMISLGVPEHIAREVLPPNVDNQGEME